MTKASHDAVVARQFGPQAQSYLTSAVHAQGADLDQIAGLVGSRPSARLLDLGCGGGHVGFRLAPQVGTVVAYDLSDQMLAVVADEAERRGLANLSTRQGAAERLPFADASFDLVISRYSAHHWQDFLAGLKEARRVLGPDGVGIFADVVSPAPALLDTWLQSLELLRDPSHVRNASVDGWRQTLAEAGFRPGEVSLRKLRLEFGSWVARMNTPDSHVQAIRSLQRQANDTVSNYFAIEQDGSFTIDAMVLVATVG
ncbi:MAG: class I SAM-dependent methyltransferase [Telmatospirillum sp.]|nr:class I SAM-dependent methyltransferase [Telmatospirillum sp.]